MDSLTPRSIEEGQSIEEGRLSKKLGTRTMREVEPTEDGSSVDRDGGSTVAFSDTLDGTTKGVQSLISLTSEERSIAHIIRRMSLLPGLATSGELTEAVKESSDVILKIRGKVGYLPPTYAAKLLFLAHARDNPTWIPFEEGQARIFATSRRADARTSFWLHPVIAIPFMLSFSCAAYIAMATFAPEHFSPREALAMVSFVSMLGSFASNIFGWWVTGVNPDQSSIVANARQNAVHDLVDLYNELAFEVIDLWKVDKRSCQVLCSRIDIAWLKEAAKKAGADDGEIQNIFNLFECAIQFIVNSVLPRYHQLVHYICTQTDQDHEAHSRRRSLSVGPALYSVVDQWITSAASLRPLRLVPCTTPSAVAGDAGFDFARKGASGSGSMCEGVGAAGAV